MTLLTFTRYARLLKVLSHPARLEVLHLLRTQPLFVQDIVTMVGRSQAFVSQQLQVLRAAGIVRTERLGRRIAYRLTSPDFIRGSDIIRAALKPATPRTSSRTIFRDPVCGMKLEPKTASFRYVHRHQPYYFCASGCWKQFKHTPSKFL